MASRRFSKPDPTISIVTVTRNDAAGLAATLASIRQQTYRYIDYVIVDGGDDTESPVLVEENEQWVRHYIREPDRGIYDAMNKGLERASGDFVCFINAGDCLYAPDTLQQVAEAISDQVDVVFGEVLFVDENYRSLGLRSEVTTQRLPEDLSWRSLALGMVVSHQGFFARRSLAPDYLQGNLCADVDWVIRVLKVSRGNVCLDRPLARFVIGGISQRRFHRAMWDRFRVLSAHFGVMRTALNHFTIIGRFLGFKFFGAP